MATSEIVGSIFFAADELLWMKELSISTSPDFIDHSWLQIDEHSTRNVFSSTSLAEEGVECIVTSAYGFVTWHLPIRLHQQSKKRRKILIEEDDVSTEAIISKQQT